MTAWLTAIALGNAVAAASPSPSATRIVITEPDGTPTRGHPSKDLAFLSDVPFCPVFCELRKCSDDENAVSMGARWVAFQRLSRANLGAGQARKYRALVDKYLDLLHLFQIERAAGCLTKETDIREPGRVRVEVSRYEEKLKQLRAPSNASHR